THSAGEEVSEQLFSLSPSVKGKTVWLDARTIEFKPEQNLDADKLYEVSFKLGKVTDASGRFSDFKFNVQTLKPSFIVKEFGLRSAGNKTTMVLLGEVETADAEDPAAIEKLLAASQGSKPLTISWQHN